VPAGRYRVESDPEPGWQGAASAAFAVDSEPVELVRLALPPAGDAAAEGAPATEAADAVWLLLGAALPVFHGRKDRRLEVEAARRRAF
jgi:hypothetical protein